MFVILTLFYTSHYREIFRKSRPSGKVSDKLAQGSIQPRFCEGLEDFGEFVAGVTCMVEATRDLT